ncbi:hypothetical protein [Cupriavidus basilensis]|uniref:Uncharacterized protein n=1 Tax=Cupriavidus basilensis TaxID=68895 RepID=A0A0C4YPL1_9BURK|nr:hypothetical protein [Cupriavidus basilensis]AJG24420.1 hypothetical protein RR42_s2839 [Cupriavidus basilensis]
MSRSKDAAQARAAREALQFCLGHGVRGYGAGDAGGHQPVVHRDQIHAARAAAEIDFDRMGTLVLTLAGLEVIVIVVCLTR